MILMLLLACRPLPGGDDYASQEDLSWLEGSEALEGDVPWSPGNLRLTVNLFYEGGASHAIPVDNLGVFYYIYEGTFFQTVTDDRVEGLAAERLVHGGGAWFGGGVHFEDGVRDFTPWSTLHLSLKSSDASFGSTRVGMITGDGQFEWPLADFGFLPDGEWHTVVLPLDELATGLERTEAPLLIVGNDGTLGDELIIDDLYWVP